MNQFKIATRLVILIGIMSALLVDHMLILLNIDKLRSSPETGLVAPTLQ